MPWAFFGLFAGLWKLVAVGSAVALFAWHKGWWRHPLLRLLRPWATRAARPTTRVVASPPPPSPSAPPPARRGLWGRILGDRWYFLLFLTAALSLLAWVVARMTIHGSIRPPG